MRSEGLNFRDVRVKGKYSFQYITDYVFENCVFDTKGAFWHAKNIVVRSSWETKPTVSKKGISMERKFWKILSCVMVTALFLSGCAEGQGDRSIEEPILLGSETSHGISDTNLRTEENMVEKVTLQIGNSSFTAASAIYYAPFFVGDYYDYW